MRRSREHDETKIGISEPDDHAAGIPGVAVALKRSAAEDGAEAVRAYAAQAQSGRRLRLHELCLAGSGPRSSAHGRVL